MRAMVRLFVAVVAAALAGACTSAPSASPPSAIPSPQPLPFELAVAPEQSVGWSIGGQHVVFLVTVSGSSGEPPVEITAEASDATVDVEPVALEPGVVGEVTVVPKAVNSEEELVVTIRASRAGVDREATRTLHLGPGEDSLHAEALACLAPFTAWLAAEHPDLGITPDTRWEGTPGSWVLVVNHYLFFSDEWELGLSWHVMIPPDDWARIYLRQRWKEVEPGLAFEIASRSGAIEPVEIVPEGIWR